VYWIIQVWNLLSFYTSSAPIITWEEVLRPITQCKVLYHFQSQTSSLFLKFFFSEEQCSQRKKNPFWPLKILGEKTIMSCLIINLYVFTTFESINICERKQFQLCKVTDGSNPVEFLSALPTSFKLQRYNGEKST